MVKEKVLIIGRTQPDWSDSEGDLVSCTVGVTPDFEWRRLRFAKLGQVRNLRVFTWTTIDMLPTTGRSRDPRPESRIINPYNPNPIDVHNQIESPAVRRWYIQQCVQPSAFDMQRNKRTLGIIKPVDLEFKIHLLKSDPKPSKPTILDWARYTDPAFERMYKELQWKREYAAKQVEVKFKFRCGPQCEAKRKHNMKVLDIELFMLYRHCVAGCTQEEAIERMTRKIESEHQKDVYLGLGTHRRYAFTRNYMVGSVMRFQKTVKAQRPLVVG